MTADFAGFLRCSAGIHSRASISARPVPSRTYDRYTVLIPLATLPTQPRYCLLTPAVCLPYVEPGVVADQHPGRIAEHHGDIAAQVIGDPARCPACSFHPGREA